MGLINIFNNIYETMSIRSSSSGLILKNVWSTTTGLQGGKLSSSLLTNQPQQRHYAAAKGGFAGGKLGGGISKKGGAKTVQKVQMPVETDAVKLATHCCGLNTLKADGEELALRPDDEYPAWLWELSVNGSGPEPDEMLLLENEEDTKPHKETLEYWARRRRVALRFKNKLSRDEFPKPFIPDKVKNLRLARDARYCIVCCFVVCLF